MKCVKAEQSVKDYIIVARRLSSELYMYNWTGELIVKVEVEGKLFGIGRGGQGRLQVYSIHDDSCDYLSVHSIG